MMQVYNVEQIKETLVASEVIAIIEEGFVLLANGRAVLPTPASVDFEEGVMHIKSGYIDGGDTAVVKIASYFSGNLYKKLEAIQGLMIVFSQHTGRPLAVLCDEGVLTYARTAAAGAVSAKFLAPKQVHHIGVIGTGKQAFVQLQYLKEVIDCRNVYVWGRTRENVEQFQKKAAELGFDAIMAATPETVAAECNLIVTTTSSTEPILHAKDIKKGTHITAIGADHPGKKELEPEIFGCADAIIVDSLAQPLKGDSLHALEKGIITKGSLKELGQVINGKEVGRVSEEDITIADLTGVGVQDSQIAEWIYQKLGGAE